MRRAAHSVLRAGALLLLGCALRSWGAQTLPQPTPEQDAAQRAALLAQREQVLQREQHARAACLQRFFVNDCLDAARRETREALAPIDAALQAISRRARERAAQAELQRIEDNLAAAQANRPDTAQTQRDRAAREAALQQREQEAASRTSRAAARAAAAPSPAATPLARHSPQRLAPSGAHPAPTSAQRAADAARARAEFAARQKAYAEKQQSRQARQAANPHQAPPLPVPPPNMPLGD